jgi:HNH endonuclease/Protein of unknown function DUF262
MKIELKEITIRELTEGYKDNVNDGVVGYGGRLDIRPPYQREFVYKDKQQIAVIETVKKNFLLNVMYWAVREDGNFEVIDGQQRTISICEFVENNVFVDLFLFKSLPKDKQEDFLNYKLMIYWCSGTDSEKLEWFRIINIAGEKLTEQELRNAVYSGSWVTDAKRHFSKNDCAAYNLGNKYLDGSAIRQDYLETTIKWLSGGKIEEYMAKNQHEPNANELWLYFQSVINWVKVTFPKYRKEMKGIEWGELYNEFKGAKLDSKRLEEEITKLMLDEDVNNKKGIYNYVLNGKEKHLNIRAFSPNQKRESYERQKGNCIVCNKHFEIEEMEADHITPWHEGGKTSADNCQMLCKHDNRRKSGK